MNKKAFLVVTLLALLASFVIPAGAADFSRKGKSEVYGVYQMMSGDTASGDTIDVKISDSSVYGVGLGINLTDNFNLNTDFLFGITNIDVTDTYEEVSGDTNLSLWNINLDYYVFKDRLTPMVTAGFGFVNFSSNFLGSNFDETDFSYNFGVGARWDATDNLFVKALYKWTFTKLKDTDNGITFDGLVIAAGLRF